jgi:HEPN domain-containing protein
VNRREFRELTTLRLAEARALLDAGLPDGAYYLAGYAVECGLKACIARQTRQHDFPPEPRTVADMYTHDLDKLISRAELRVQLQAEMISDPACADNWRTVRAWSERSRYDRWSATEAERLHLAIVDRRHGVLRWLRQHW